MDKVISLLLHDVPVHADYACDATDLDLEDIPEERIINLLNSSDENIIFEAAKLLTHWGQTSGFDVLVNLLDDNKLDGYIDHRLHGYDDTFQHVLRAFVRYWAIQCDLGFGEPARIKIFSPIKKIIEKSNTQRFNIKGLFWVIEECKYSEYIPLIKNHLIQIIDHPKLQFWKIHDGLEFMLKLNPELVHNLLDEKGKTLEDFKINNL
ncbi:hypothetical protein [Acinetobacter sp. ANC 4648]|uniref:hypothetical protein n=1 Tax=Acinetobacter sp. ANC 4648 TaxID=1977875 RepID=UPI000A3584FF|nr:hypothetical protein [Acinetobacter sp. ANC 4648]OTG82285.1 hypothetical protein B9T27_08545 [Acinetobacter sp. ANC 4648]